MAIGQKFYTKKSKKMARKEKRSCILKSDLLLKRYELKLDKNLYKRYKLRLKTGREGELSCSMGKIHQWSEKLHEFRLDKREKTPYDKACKGAFNVEG